MSLNVPATKIRVGSVTGYVRAPKIGHGLNTQPAPKILKQHRFPTAAARSALRGSRR